MTNLFEMLEFSKQLSLEAGAIISGSFDKTEPEYSKRKGVVTEADRESDRYIRTSIEKAYPDHAILSEESRRKKGNSIEWVIDPVDGTNNYIIGDPRVGISIGLRMDEKPIMGVINFPMLGELYYALAEHGAFCFSNGTEQRIMVNKAMPRQMYILSLAVGFMPWNREIVNVNNVLGFFDALSRIDDKKNPSDPEKTLPFDDFRPRINESTTFDMCMVARGRYGAHYNNICTPWDATAGHVIVVEAGGACTNLCNNFMIASNGVGHDAQVRFALKYYFDKDNTKPI